MDTEEQEEDLRAVEAQELKPEQLDSTRASQKGALSISSHCLHLCVCVGACVFACCLCVLLCNFPHQVWTVES